MSGILRDSVELDQRDSVTGVRLYKLMIRDGLLGEVIQAHCKRRGIKRAEFARLCDIPYMTMVDIWNGRSNKTKPEYLERISSELGIEVSELLSGIPTTDVAEKALDLQLSAREKRLIAAYRNANAAVRRAIEGAAGIPFNETEEPRPARKRRVG